GRHPAWRVGARLRGRPQHRRGLHPPDPTRRRRAVRAALDRDGSWCRLPHRRRSGPRVRRRITVLAAVIVAAVLTIVGLAVVTTVRNELYDNLDRSLAQRAADVDAAARSDADPVIVTADVEDHFVQVLDLD